MHKLTNRFIIVLPVFNGERTIAASLGSILRQRYDDLGIIIRDDMSTDGTPAILEAMTGVDGIRKNYACIDGKEILYIRNTRKMYGGGNTYDSVKNFVGHSNAVIGVVDGDDSLTDDHAVGKIYSIYDDHNMWMVWSQHRLTAPGENGCVGYSSALPPDSMIYAGREYWAVSHFRTSRAWLYDLIQISDIHDPYVPGAFFKVAADAALLYPMIELCGNKRSYFLDECLYLYNNDLATNESSLYADEVTRYTRYIRDKQRRYAPYSAMDQLLIPMK